MFLDTQGWKHHVKNKRTEVEPYKPGDENKVWYTRSDASTISHAYLVLLAQGEVEVPHDRSEQHYKTMLTGVQPDDRRKRKRCNVKFLEVDEEAWDISIPEKKQKRARRTPGKAKGSLDAAPVFAELSEGEDEQDDMKSESGSSGSGKRSVLSHEEPAADPEPPLPPPLAPPQVEEPRQAPAEPPDAEPRQARAEPVRHDPIAAIAEYDVGVNRLTEVRDPITCDLIGYEVGCLHPEHRTPDCRKNIRCEAKGRTRASTLLMLKVWLARGRDLECRKEHQDLWPEIEKAYFDGSLPDAIEAVRDFRVGMCLGGEFARVSEAATHSAPGSS